MIDILDDFPHSIQQDPVFGDMLTECLNLVAKCHEYTISKMPAMTFSHIKVRLELGDSLESEINQKVSQLQIARHIRERKFRLHYKTEVENSIDDHGKSKYFCESCVEGTPLIADHRLVLNCMTTLATALDKYSWLIKNIKDRTKDMFEKTK